MALSYRMPLARHLQDGGQGRQIGTTWGLGTDLCQSPDCSCALPRERQMLLAGVCDAGCLPALEALGLGGL